MTVLAYPDNPALDAKIEQTGIALRQAMRGEIPGIFNKAFWEGMILEWAMKDPSFKTDMFRLVDVLPLLETKEQVARHVREYLLKEGRKLPLVLSAALKAATGSLTAGIGAWAVRNNVSGMAQHFIAGRNAGEALKVLGALHKDGMAFTVDLLGEMTLSDREAEAYQARYLDLITTLADEALKWPADEIIDQSHRSPIPRVNVSIKLSAMDPQLDAIDITGAVSRLKNRLFPLFLKAKEKNIALTLDLEQWALHGIAYDFFEEMAAQSSLRNWPHLGIVIQAYLHGARRDLERLLSIARSRGTPIGVRLVKGAYWDYEVVQARQNGLSCPVFLDKATSDANYELLTTSLLESIERISPAFASHNLRSLAHAIAQAAEMRVPKPAFEFQMLYGMAEPERKAIRSRGYRVRVYAPVGELLPGMAYLVRRLLENTSNSGFLKLSYHDQAELKTLLARPRPRAVPEWKSPMVSGDLGTPFDNCPILDFTDENVRRRFLEIQDCLAKRFPLAVPIVIDGKKRFGKQTQERYCPSDTNRLVARIAQANREEAEEAVQAAWKAWPNWRDLPLLERAKRLDKLADRLTDDRHELAALMAFEVGKPWREADADVAEAIDFCRYYARQALIELGPRKQGNVPGEDSILFYEGRGPTTIIAPWNFPLAILCGMTAAALVSGNTVLIKPSGQSTAIGYALLERLLATGFPAGVAQFLPGPGRDIGAFLIAHPLVAQIAFTGSKEAGLSILEKSARTQTGQPQVRRIVCEMGGKNAVIIDDDADLDEAVSGVVKSAFGYAGQKCSACSRVILVGGIYEGFVNRLIEACRSLTIAPAHLPSCQLGPVIDRAAYDRLMHLIRNPDPGATPLFIGEAPDGGYYAPPALFAVSDISHRFMQEEFFGPIVALLKAGTFEEAIEAVNACEFKLTGGVYSRSPSRLEQARKSFRVGNLYLNRPCTGAIVDRHPFGGFGMSGIGSKAGGPGYLHFFSDPRCVTENTLRRGFAPDMES